MTETALPEVTLRFPVWGVSVGIQSAACGVLESFRRLYGGFAGTGESGQSCVFRIAAKGDGWDVFEGGEKQGGAATVASALLLAESLIINRVGALRSDLLSVHGATLWTPHGGLLLTGASGAGKSTLSLALTSLGWKVCTDDFGLLDMADASLLPMPRFFHLDAESMRLLEAVGVDLPDGSGVPGILTPCDLGWDTPMPIGVRRIVYLDGCEDPDRPLLGGVSQAEMLALLTSESGREGVFWEEDLAKLARLAAGAECYRMGRAELGRMTAGLAQLFSCLGPAVL